MAAELRVLETNLKTEVQSLTDQLDGAVQEAKERMPEMSAFALVFIDRDGSVLPFVASRDHAPLHPYTLPEVVKVAVLGEVLADQ